jgi:hypothetical protein
MLHELFGPTGYPIFREAFENIRERRMTMELSMTIALLAALFIGEFFTALVISVFVLVAEVLEGLTVNRGRRAIGDLLDLLPHSAWIVKDGTAIEIPVGELRAGDRVLEEYSPIFNRSGLIVDVRHNRGGNIDSWVLGKLMRKAWMYWQPRVGRASWNMQEAFRGPIVVLCDQWTASDGEAFSEGFKRLGLGKVIGTRTWGGEIWLSASNRLADNGIASAAELGVYGPEGKWLIEGHGVDPDIVVDDLPHARFEGKDEQLETALQYLNKLIREHPAPVPPHPSYPDKSFQLRHSVKGDTSSVAGASR